MVEPIPVRPRDVATPLEAERPESSIAEERLMVVADIWNVATVICPLGTCAALEPRLIIRQVTWPTPFEHDSTSPLAVAVALAAMVTELKSPVE